MFMFLSGILVDLVKRMMGFLGRNATSYRPEQHYMRGPGPAVEKKRAIADTSSRPSRSALR